MSKTAEPFQFAADRTPGVRAYSIGPNHCDWLCLKCGAVGREHGGKLIEKAWAAARGDCFEHLQHHVRFESINPV